MEQTPQAQMSTHEPGVLRTQHTACTRVTMAQQSAGPFRGQVLSLASSPDPHTPPCSAWGSPGTTFQHGAPWPLGGDK